jgi:hypothetical protein
VHASARLRQLCAYTGPSHGRSFELPNLEHCAAIIFLTRWLRVPQPPAATLEASFLRNASQPLSRFQLPQPRSSPPSSLSPSRSGAPTAARAGAGTDSARRARPFRSWSRTGPGAVVGLFAPW